MNKPPVVMGSYRELQIVNGQVVKNVELVEQVSPEKDVIKGNINGNPVFITRSLKRHLKRSNKKRQTKRKAKRSNKKRQAKRSKRGLRTTAKK